MVFRDARPYTLLYMQTIPVPRPLLLLFFIVWTTGPLAAVSVGVDLGGGLLAADAPGYGPKLQAGGSIAAVLMIPLAGWIDLTTSLELFGVLPSDTNGGFSYRGFGGGALAAGVELAWPVLVSRSVGTLSLGGTLGFAASVPAYEYTALYFYYPEVRSGLLLLWLPVKAPKFLFRLALPVRVQFRRDLSWSVSAGLQLGFSYSLGGRP